MKFTVYTRDLAPSLKQISSLCSKRSTLPILSCCMMQAEGERLNIRATNLEIELSIEIPVNVVQEGSCCVNGSKINEIVRELGLEDSLTMEKDEVGWAKIKSGRSNFKLAARDTEDYPENSNKGNEGVEVVLDSGLLKSFIIRSSYACSTDKNTAISGVLFQKDDQFLTMVSTDGHRLVCLQHEVVGLPIINVILPKEALKYLLGMMKEGSMVSCHFQENGASFSGEGWNLFMRSLEGPYPEYKYVIPSSPTGILNVNREKFMGAIRIVSIVCDDKFKPVNIYISGDELRVFCNSQGTGDAEDIINCEFDGDEITLSFSAIFLYDALNVISSKNVIMEITDPMSAVILRETHEKNKNDVHVIMPIRIK